MTDSSDKAKARARAYRTALRNTQRAMFDAIQFAPAGKPLNRLCDMSDDLTDLWRAAVAADE